jgi:MOSC domain-containing protein YiiM
MQQGKLESISIRHSKESETTNLSNAMLTVGVGIDGHYKTGGDKQISIITQEAKRRLESIDPPGVCFHKFTENLLISGIDLSDLSIGDTLSIGRAVLQVTDKKECFPACRLYAQHIICPLADSAYFLKVMQSAPIQCGDLITIQ